MAGVCKGHEELAATAIPLEASLPVVPARGGEALVRRLFEPLGYEVEVDGRSRSTRSSRSGAPAATSSCAQRPKSGSPIC